MKKIKLLQLLIYIAFGLLIVHDVLPDATRGFKDGWRDGQNQALGKTSPTQLLPVVLNGNIVAPHDGTLKINEEYSLQNIYVNAEVLLNASAPADKLLTGITIVLVLGITALLILTAVTINNIIISIASGDVFENRCIRYLRRTGLLLLTYAVADVVYQRTKIAVLRDIIHEPLQVYNTTSFNFQILICAILAFIVAEAFKYGAQLKAEQELTI